MIKLVKIERSLIFLIMLKEAKLEYQRELEDYMETNKIYDVFESMMKELIIDLPKDPVKFLLDKLGEDGEPI